MKKKEQEVIAQEWIVRFDGEIKRLEKKIRLNKETNKMTNKI